VTPSKTADFSKIDAAQSFTFGTETKCDETKWASATACKGFGGVWGTNSNTWAVGTTAGTHRYYHWLADAATSFGDILSIEDKAVVNVLLVENHADVYDATPANKCSTTAPNGQTYHATGTATYTKGSNGATSTILGASALIAGVLASLF
jgi:hypothetical protein